MHYCPGCEAELPANAHFCSRCGYALEATTIINRATRHFLSVNEQSPGDSTVGSRISTLPHKMPDGETPIQYCPACQAKLGKNAHFCSHCGRAVRATNTVDGATNVGQFPQADVQIPDISITVTRLSALYYNILSKLPLPVRHTIAAMLTRARDSKPEKFQTSDQKVAGSHFTTWGWLPLLTLTSALGILSVVYAYNNARFGATGVDFFFWLGLLLIFVPSMVRLMSPKASRFERISLLCVVAISFYLVNVLDGPVAFLGFDPLIHTLTADNIARSGHLFNVNPLLPASSFYPGLEILTNALSNLSGLNTFSSGTIVLGVARLMMILSLFMLFEQITKSARTAGIATMLYMTNPHFLFFDAGFSYESLALPLATVMLFAAARSEILKSNRLGIPLAAWIVLMAVVVTHHMTSFVFDGFLILWAAAYGFQHPSRLYKSIPAKTALYGILISLAWIGLPGNPVVGYLSSYFGSAANNLVQVFTGTSSARPLFVSYSGQPTPLWERGMVVASEALIVLGLPLGLLCLWQRYRYKALAWMFGIASIFYPISQAFRFTNFGSEISDRAAAFLFIPIACILGIFIAQFWPTQWLSRRQTSLITCALSVVFLGGVVLGTGPSWSFMPGPYLVAADARSVETEGIQAAQWAYAHLGPNNNIATDRTNQLLMSVYGQQRIVSSLEDKIDVTPVFFSSSFGPYEVAILRSAKVRYLVVDLRLSTALPSVGVYFEVGEPGSYQHTSPISLKALTKFSTISQIDRVFDSGDIVIYDVGELINASEKP